MLNFCASKTLVFSADFEKIQLFNCFVRNMDGEFPSLTPSKRARLSPNLNVSSESLSAESNITNITTYNFNDNATLNVENWNSGSGTQSVQHLNSGG